MTVGAKTVSKGRNSAQSVSASIAATEHVQLTADRTKPVPETVGNQSSEIKSKFEVAEGKTAATTPGKKRKSLQHQAPAKTQLEHLQKCLADAKAACDQSRSDLQKATNMWQSTRSNGEKTAKDLHEAQETQKRLELCRKTNGQLEKKLVGIEMSLLRQESLGDVNLKKEELGKAMAEAGKAREAYEKERLQHKQKIEQLRLESRLKPLRETSVAAANRMRLIKKELAQLQAKEKSKVDAKRRRVAEPGSVGDSSSSSGTVANID